jgi:hypothetical protein
MVFMAERLSPSPSALLDADQVGGRQYLAKGRRLDGTGELSRLRMGAASVIGCGRVPARASSIDMKTMILFAGAAAAMAFGAWLASSRESTYEAAPQPLRRTNRDFQEPSNRPTGTTVVLAGPDEGKSGVAGQDVVSASYSGCMVSSKRCHCVDRAGMTVEVEYSDCRRMASGGSAR